ncbi:D-alanyl-D-alanine carboxypeptidase family protein [Bacillus zhangzhouensis]|uniref:D-alanyl-D-alanine carboxypeptidase family protein n=1 Tax=Bacillus zhangzhouensis TaxID=1178540 RepID=UPI002E249922|nr:serine hydrolase [Bacillus zhangzhouensis]
MRKVLIGGKIFVIIVLLIVVWEKVEEQIHVDMKQFIPFSGANEFVSPNIYMIDRESGDVVYEKKAKSKVYPASLTKIMTVIVALEHLDDLTKSVSIDQNTYQDMISKNSSMAGFLGGETVTYRDLLYGTMLPSGGEAANSLAIHTAGNVKDFVRMMNEKAAELGLHDTHFMNPEGLHDENQYTTAYDVASMLSYALNVPHFREVFTKETFQTSPTKEHPTGVLLKSTVLTLLHQEDKQGFEIIGGKSGTTSEAGQCWASLGVVNDREYITVVMGAPLEDIRHPDRQQIKDTMKLYQKVTAI